MKQAEVVQQRGFITLSNKRMSNSKTRTLNDDLAMMRKESSLIIGTPCVLLAMPLTRPQYMNPVAPVITVDQSIAALPDCRCCERKTAMSLIVED